MKLHMPEHPNAGKRGYVQEHVYLAAKALGRAVPKGAEVHHVNGIKTDNRPENLVLYESRAYHKLLHQRQRALEECGNANWRKCRHCKAWDAPERLHVPGSGAAYHLECARQDANARNAAKRGASCLK